MTDDILYSTSNYLELRHNPISLLSLISKHVKVQLIKNKTFSGYIHSIDPMTHSIILLVSQNHAGTFQTIIIPGHAVLDVTEAVPETDIRPSVKLVTAKSENDTSERKLKLISWLKLNMLPVTESSDNIIFGNVSILPPYEVTDICTDNTIVALQVMKIMQNMPENFDPNATNIKNMQEDKEI